MYKKVVIIILAGIGVSVISMALFISWLSLAGCPPSYWVETEVITEPSSPTTNITRGDLPSSSILRTMLIEISENTSLISDYGEVTYLEWNTTILMLEASNVVPVENYPNWSWAGFIYFEDVLILVQLFVMVC
ncbi:MAG: hypothetical protein ACW99Q_08090 [Candidatus Kariarchaeaceae archaeon]|jgi:hypothetical protein